MKRIATLLLALVMLLSLAITVSADGEAPTGTITVNGTTAGKEYAIYKIFDLTMSGSGASATYAYTINSNWEDFFSDTGAGKKYLTTTESDYPIIVDGVKKYINITETNMAAFAKDAMAYALSTASVSTVEATGTSVTFANLTLGYYLVYPKGATNPASGYSTICSLTTTNPNAEVNVKAEYPTINKTADKTESVAWGEEITYTITGKVPDTTGYSDYIYKITDTMSEGLTFGGTDTIEVTINGTDVTNACTRTPSGNGFVLTIPVKDYQMQVGKDIVVTYTATANEKAVARVENNTAVLEYSNGPDATTQTTPSVQEVYSLKIVIDKYKANAESTKLPGAKFVLQNSEGKFYKLDNNVVSWVENMNAATPVITDASGAAKFEGLAAGNYKLIETEAPAGYNKLTDPVNVNLARTGEEGNYAYSVSVKVPNQSGSVLPGTGGIGTTIFYIIGGCLVLAAVVLLITKKRMASTAK